MDIEIVPLISFVMVSTFTPGPNNISSASMGVMVGYRKTVNYLLGIASGFFVIMIACAYLSSALLTIIPAAERYLRWIGGGYILWLAIGILRANDSLVEPDGTAAAFTKGFVLQLFNPKVFIYGLTLYSTFLAAIANRFDYLSFFAVAFALIAFTATSLWAFAGAAIKNKLGNDRVRSVVNTILSLLLIYTAIELSGVATFW